MKLKITIDVPDIGALPNHGEAVENILDSASPNIRKAIERGDSSGKLVFQTGAHEFLKIGKWRLKP